MPAVLRRHQIDLRQCPVIVYVATPTPLCEIPFPCAMALIVVVVETETVHGFEHDVDEVDGKDPFVV